MISHSRYRGDINFLRALAIMAVVGYHFDFAALSGGFAGVDIFFVVSGYLMTQIIWGKLEAGEFSLFLFYQARAARILPALIGLICGLLIFGLFWLDALRLDDLAGESLSSLLFYSNLIFWLRAGYFDPGSETKILLHTWSLSVEWQFYMLYPFLLMIAYRFFKQKAGVIVLLAGILSFLAAIYFSTRRADFDFYLLPTRAWEMAAGGVPYLFRLDQRIPRNRRMAAGIIGFALIAATLFAVRSKAPWPGTATLPVVLGTSIIIIASVDVPRVYNNIAVRCVGLWSYSIYLWHWPILVLLKYFGTATAVGKLQGLFVTVAIAGLSYNFVEKNGGARKAGPRVPVLEICFATSIVISVVVFALTGLPERFGGNSSWIKDLAAASADWTYPKDCGGFTYRGDIRKCSIGSGSRRVLVIGDSYAEQLFSFMKKQVEANSDLSITFVTLGGCPPVPNVNLVKVGSRCSVFYLGAVGEAQQGDYSIVIIASVWARYFDTDDAHRDDDGKICFLTNGTCVRPSGARAQAAGFVAVFDALGNDIGDLRRAGRNVILVLPTPFPPGVAEDLPRELARREFLNLGTDGLDSYSLAEFRARTAFVRDNLARISSQVGAVLFDPVADLCDDGSCPLVNTARHPLYRDDSHLRSSYVETLSLPTLATAISGK